MLHVSPVVAYACLRLYVVGSFLLWRVLAVHVKKRKLLPGLLVVSRPFRECQPIKLLFSLTERYIPWAREGKTHFSTGVHTPEATKKQGGGLLLILNRGRLSRVSSSEWKEENSPSLLARKLLSGESFFFLDR